MSTGPSIFSIFTNPPRAVAEAGISNMILKCTNLISIAFVTDMYQNPADTFDYDGLGCSTALLACTSHSLRTFIIELYITADSKLERATRFRDWIDGANWVALEDRLLKFPNLECVRIVFHDLRNTWAHAHRPGTDKNNVEIEPQRQQWREIWQVCCRLVNGKLAVLQSTGVKVVVDPSERGVTIP